jgi:hypothetical protein
MDSILSCEIPFLNLTNNSYGMNCGVWDFPGLSKVGVEVAFWFLTSQDVESHRADAHIMIGASGISRPGKGGKDIIGSPLKQGSSLYRLLIKPNPWSTKQRYAMGE